MIIHVVLYFVCKVIRWVFFNICNTQVTCYMYRSLFISFVYFRIWELVWNMRIYLGSRTSYWYLFPESRCPHSWSRVKLVQSIWFCIYLLRHSSFWNFPLHGKVAQSLAPTKLLSILSLKPTHPIPFFFGTFTAAVFDFIFQTWIGYILESFGPVAVILVACVYRRTSTQMQEFT